MGYEEFCRSRRVLSASAFGLCGQHPSWSQNSSYPTQPHSVIAKVLDHQACFHILTTSWQFTGAICHFSLENVIPITHEQNIIWSKTRLDGTTHEQTIICRQLFSGHVVGSRPMKRRKNASNDKYTYLQTHQRMCNWRHPLLTAKHVRRKLSELTAQLMLFHLWRLMSFLRMTQWSWAHQECGAGHYQVEECSSTNVWPITL